MRTSWRPFLRRVATVCFVGCATAWSQAMCYAQIAADNASNAAYADGWQGTTTDDMTGATQTVGDNGGFGFTPWNFDNDFIFADDPIGVYEVDGPPPNQSQFNQVGTSWQFGITFFQNPNDPNSKDIARAGRGLAVPLQIGQTLSIVSDPPSESAFFDILSIDFITGGGNICYGGVGCTSGTAPVSRFDLGFFNYGNPNNYGRWNASSIGPTSMFLTDKAPGQHPQFPMGAPGSDSGMRLDFTLTGAETFNLALTPLDNPSQAFAASGTLDNPGAGAIDWIQFLHWAEESDELFPTDWYIRSLTVTGPAANADFDGDGDEDGADFLRWQRGVGITSGAMLGQGDSDGDGDVDGTDLANWKGQFASSAAAAGGIPEPSAVALALAGVAGASWWERRRPKKH
jgi:hypothetical protein